MTASSSELTTSKPWQFKKGQSGNPSGRPRIVLEIREVARKHGNEAITAILALARAAQDEKVRMAAWREILDRGYGRPAQAITGEGGEGPAVIVVDTGIRRDADTES